MDFRLTQEQELLRESARRYFAGEDSFDKRRQNVRQASEHDCARFAEFGWTAMLAPEDCDGLGSSIEDIAILSEEMGRGLALCSFVGAVLPARVLQACKPSMQSRAKLSAVAQGSLRLALAVYEPNRRYQLLPQASAVASADGSWKLSGEKSLVSGGALADQLIVSAVIEAAGTVRSALFLVDTKAPGLKRRTYQTIDDIEVADFHFKQVAVSKENLLADTDAALEILQTAVDEATVCLCAETLGVMDRAIELAAEYLKVRKQFGQTLAEFQALQHSVAEMWIEANSARSILYRAIAALGGDAAERGKAVAGCSIKLMQAAKSVTGTAVHLHGGIGVSCEYPVGHYLRRVLVSERMLGDREHHLARYLA